MSDAPVEAKLASLVIATEVTRLTDVTSKSRGLWRSLGPVEVRTKSKLERPRLCATTIEVQCRWYCPSFAEMVV
jgi:hypothetical protein